MGICRKYTSMIAGAADLRAVYEPHAAKKIAREFGVAVVTAKIWLSGRFPIARQEELRRRIVAELDRQDLIRAEIRRRWSGETSEANSAVGRGRAGLARAKADRLGGAMTR
jgi:hypothetical protein